MTVQYGRSQAYSGLGIGTIQPLRHSLKYPDLMPRSQRIHLIVCQVLLIILLATIGTTTIVYAQVRCWAPSQHEGPLTDKRWVRQLKAMKTAEVIIKQSQEFMNPPVPVRMRTTMVADRHDLIGSQLIVRAYPEETTVGINLWRGTCEINSQADRMAGSIGKINVLFNALSKDMFMGQDEIPKLTGTRGGYPEYNGWVVLTKNGRLPWIPQTLSDRLDRIGVAREKAVTNWRHAKASRKVPDHAMIDRTAALLRTTDPAGADQYLENMKRLTADIHAAESKDAAHVTHLITLLDEYRTYRASFTPVQLAMPAIWADPDGSARATMEARINELQELRMDDQERVGEIREHSRGLDRQAAAADDEATALRLRAQARELLQDADQIRKDHMERAVLEGEALQGSYELTNLKPGSAEQALAYKLDPSFPNRNQSGKIQVIAVSVSPVTEKETLQRPEQAARNAWLDRVTPSINYAALAALLD